MKTYKYWFLLHILTYQVWKAKDADDARIKNAHSWLNETQREQRILKKIKLEKLEKIFCLID